MKSTKMEAVWWHPNFSPELLLEPFPNSAGTPEEGRDSLAGWWPVWGHGDGGSFSWACSAQGAMLVVPEGAGLKARLCVSLSPEMSCVEVLPSETNSAPNSPWKNI